MNGALFCRAQDRERGKNPKTIHDMINQNKEVLKQTNTKVKKEYSGELHKM